MGLLLLAALLTLTAFGETNGVPVTPFAPMTPPADLLMLLTAVVVPLLVAVGKWAAPRLPTWTLPIIAPALGALVDYLISLASGGHFNPIMGALLGSAGVGIREMKDQVQQRIVNKPAPPSNQ